MSSGVVLVSGAATPLGRAIVRKLAFAGYKVAAADSCKGSITQVAEENTKVGGKVQAFVVDVSRKDHREELVGTVASALGGLDSLIVVPGQNEVRGSILDTSSMQFDSAFTKYVSVPFRLAQVSMEELGKSKNGTITFISSTAGYQPFVDLGMYSVTQSAVLSMTKAVSVSAAAKNVRVNSVVTGFMDGDGSSGLWDAQGNSEEVKGKEIRDSICRMIPMNRLGKPSDAASLIEFLISERAKYITGENVVLSGGVGVRF